MERPTSIPGLALHLVRTRWHALSSRGRMLTVAVGATALLGGAWGAHAMSGGCCASHCASGGCPMQHHAEQADEGGEGGCPFPRH